MIVSGGQSASASSSLGYALHDKSGGTVERVGEIEAVNLLSGPYEAHKEMQATIDAAQIIKQRNGDRPSKAPQKPIFTMSLSWHPDDHPSPSHMVEQAKDALNRIGLSERQAVIVQHTERKHPHVHVVVNLIHPETGRKAPLPFVHARLNQWAREYEEQRTIRTLRTPMELTPSAKEKAALIKQALKAKEVHIKAMHRDENAAERKVLVERYHETRKEIYDRYQRAADNVRDKGKAPEPKLEPNGPRHPPPREWMQIAKLIKNDWFSPKYKDKEEEQKPNPGVLRPLFDKEQGQKSSLPIPRGNTKGEQYENLRKDRQAELQALAIQHHKECDALVIAQSKPNAKQQADLDKLQAQRDKAWANWRETYNIPDREQHLKEKRLEQAEKKIKAEFEKVAGPDKRAEHDRMLGKFEKLIAEIERHPGPDPVTPDPRLAQMEARKAEIEQANQPSIIEDSLAAIRDDLEAKGYTQQQQAEFFRTVASRIEPPALEAPARGDNGLER